jgi:hypothetical protein
VVQHIVVVRGVALVLSSTLENSKYLNLSVVLRLKTLHCIVGAFVRVWVVYLTPKIERVISLLSASPVGEARCQCRKVWLTRIDCYYCRCFREELAR